MTSWNADDCDEESPLIQKEDAVDFGKVNLGLNQNTNSGNYPNVNLGLNQNTNYGNYPNGKVEDKKSDDLSSSSSSYSKSVVWAMCGFASIGGFLFGYDTGVTSGSMLLIKDSFSLNSFWQEFVVTFAIVAAFFAALTGGTLSDTFGRRSVILMASLVFALGAVVQGAAQNVAMLIVGRALVGTGYGFGSMTVTVYIAECSPAHIRGCLVSTNSLFLSGGQFVASLVDAGFSYLGSDSWRYMLAFGGIPSAIQFLAFLFVFPETPRWLMSKGRKEEARRVLVRLRGRDDVDIVMEDIQAGIDQERLSYEDFSCQGMSYSMITGTLLVTFDWYSNTFNGEGSTFVRMLRTPKVRRTLVVGCVIQLLQPLVGLVTILYYSASIISMSGVSDKHEALFLATATASTSFVFTFVGVWLVDRVGRKKLGMCSLLGTGLSLALSAIAFQLSAINSPPISHHGYNMTAGRDDYLQCSSYKWCEQCVEDPECGFCYRTIHGSIMGGTCLHADSSKNDHSTYGQCVNATLTSGQSWAYNYCPNPYWWMAILGMVLYLAFFFSGMSPIPWLVNSEIYPLWARSTGNSLSAATNWFASILISMTFLTLTETLTIHGTYWLFSGFACLGLMFFAFYVPETKGKTLEDIEELFKNPWCSCCGPCLASHTSHRMSRDTQSSNQIKDENLALIYHC